MLSTKYDMKRIRPSLPDAMLHSVMAKVKPFSPFGDVKRNLAYSHAMAACTVPILLRQCRPSTVFGRVGTVVINTVNRMLIRRSWTHITQKRCEAISPALTDFNATSAVASVATNIRVSTARFHRVPYTVLSGGRATMRRIKMGVVAFVRNSRTLTTSAGSCVALLSEGSSADNFLSSTIASAQPSRLSTFVTCAFEYYQKAKTLTGEVFDWHRHRSKTMITCKEQDVNPQNSVRRGI